MEFCKAFNAKTQKMEKGMPIPVVITAYQDRSFTFEMKTPPVTYFLKKAAKLDKGSKKPGLDSLARSRGRSRDRREEDEGSERERRRSRDEDDRRLGPFDGLAGGGLRSWHS
jgi:hypothetical protein